ncbi:hypothetical protein N7475_006471 [Penicillium sp. IBT 31633x]|nr:hypothetical protein N7475_006471 [Penicillium sp. IBT 31633x]
MSSQHLAYAKLKVLPNPKLVCELLSCFKGVDAKDPSLVDPIQILRYVEDSRFHKSAASFPLCVKRAYRWRVGLESMRNYGGGQ